MIIHTSTDRIVVPDECTDSIFHALSEALHYSVRSLKSFVFDSGQLYILDAETDKFFDLVREILDDYTTRNLNEIARKRGENKTIQIRHLSPYILCNYDESLDGRLS